VSLVWMVFIACGKKDIVVQNAATKPIIVVMFMMKNELKRMFRNDTNCFLTIFLMLS
jgi:hypothetical protein